MLLETVASSRLRAGALLVLLGGLALLLSSALQGFFLFEGILSLLPPPGGEFVFAWVILFWVGLAVFVLGAGVFVWGFANWA